MERNLEESKLPAAAFKLAPTSNSETVPGSKEEAQKNKRQAEVQQRQEKMSQILKQYSLMKSEIMNSFLNGFNQATMAGPLCEEPMQGACFIIQNCELVQEEAKEGEESKAAADDQPAAADLPDESEINDTFGQVEM